MLTFVFTFIALPLLSLIQHATLLPTHTHAYTLVLYETLTSFLALMDSRPPLSSTRRIASKDPDPTALCSGVSPPYCDIWYIHLLYDNTLILGYTYTIHYLLLICTKTHTNVHIYTHSIFVYTNTTQYNQLYICITHSDIDTSLHIRDSTFSTYMLYYRYIKLK